MLDKLKVLGKLWGLFKTITKGDLPATVVTVAFWTSVVSIIVVVFGLNIDAATQAEIAAIIAAVAGALVAAWNLYKRLSKPKE